MSPAATLGEHGGTTRRLLIVLSDGLAYDHGYTKDYGYPTTEIEQAILTQEAGITPELAHSLVRLAHAIRRIDTPGLREVASTRVLVAAAELTTEGLTAQHAAQAAIAAPLSDDPAVQAGLRQMIDTYLQ